MANAPLSGRDGEEYATDLGQTRSEIFLQMGLDTTSCDLPRGQNQSDDFRKAQRHPEVLAVFGEPRRMVFSAVRAAILRGSQELAPQDDGSTGSVRQLRKIRLTALGERGEGFGRLRSREALPEELAFL